MIHITCDTASCTKYYCTNAILCTLVLFYCTNTNTTAVYNCSSNGAYLKDGVACFLCIIQEIAESFRATRRYRHSPISDRELVRYVN